MSNYMFAPSPSSDTGEHPFVTWDNGFSDEEIQAIITMCEARHVATATLDKGSIDESIRRSKVSWLDLQDDSRWIYDRLAYIARRLNGQYYQFDLHGFVEDFQFTIYDSEELGHYDWHIDSGASTDAPRKFSMVLQLSDPSEYEGGELQILNSKDALVVEKKKGFVAAFPSYTVHRVTPVTKGTRKTLVAWIVGPKFR